MENMYFAELTSFGFFDLVMSNRKESKKSRHFISFFFFGHAHNITLNALTKIVIQIVN